MNTNNLREHLGNIAKLFYDGVEGYRDAADKVKQTEFKGLFENFSKERQRMLSEINREIVNLGGTAINTGDINGTLYGQMHKFWLNLKTNLSLNKTETLLDEIETAEKYVLDKIENILENKAEMAPTTVKVLEDAHHTISMRLKSINHLEEVTS